MGAHKNERLYRINPFAHSFSPFICFTFIVKQYSQSLLWSNSNIPYSESRIWWWCSDRLKCLVKWFLDGLSSKLGILKFYIPVPILVLLLTWSSRSCPCIEYCSVCNWWKSTSFGFIKCKISEYESSFCPLSSNALHHIFDSNMWDGYS